MNKVILMGRLTRDPEVRYSQGENATCISRYSLAIDRKIKTNDGQAADFITCVAFGKNGEFAEKYLKQGTKISIIGRLQSGSYTNKDGVKVYTTDVIVEEHEFAESKRQDSENAGSNAGSQQASGSDGFMNLPQGIDEELPFN